MPTPSGTSMEEIVQRYKAWAGDLIPLPGQPCERWDGGMIRMGLAHLQASQRAERPSRWHLQAGLAAEHALAPSAEATDWAAVGRWYELLVQVDPGSAPAALRAHTLAALSMACERLGQADAARRHLHEAVAAAPREADARLLRRRLRTLG